MRADNAITFLAYPFDPFTRYPDASTLQYLADSVQCTCPIRHARCPIVPSLSAFPLGPDLGGEADGVPGFLIPTLRDFATRSQAPFSRADWTDFCVRIDVH